LQQVLQADEKSFHHAEFEVVMPIINASAAKELPNFHYEIFNFLHFLSPFYFTDK